MLSGFRDGFSASPTMLSDITGATRARPGKTKLPEIERLHLCSRAGFRHSKCHQYINL
ncbi:MAG: hypothetical protein M3Q99_03425 [Acidobacteriota bacterium]|nr:hypothetical protein [Acidobacteriota bacterium]